MTKNRRTADMHKVIEAVVWTVVVNVVWLAVFVAILWDGLRKAKR